MKAKWIKRLPCLLLCLSLATAAIAQSDTPSVLELVQNVDDPELGELIRVALEIQTKSRNPSQEEILELTNKVTLSYTQIKLLNHQIQEVSRKIAADTGPVEMHYSLLMAKTELEAKRMTEVANLRKVMGITPRHAFEEQPIDALNTWLNLDVIGERVYVLEGQKRFFEDWKKQRWKSAGLLSEKETLDYISKRLKHKKDLPIRIDIYYKSAASSAAQDLRGKIVSLAKESNSQMQTQMCMELISTFVGSGESPLFLRDGNIRTFYPWPVMRPDGGPRPLVTGLVNPNDLEQHILWRLTMPKNVPLTIRIEYDEPSALTARQVAETAKAVAKRLGISDVVKVVEVLIEPVPEAAFLGQWQAVADTDIREIELQAGGQSRLMMRAGRAGQTTQPAPWMLTTKEVFIYGVPGVTWRGYLNTEGNLVISRGQIYPQGSWHSEGRPEMVFKRVY